MTSLPRLREPGAVFLLSTYELGHQPLGLASTAGLLREHGYRPALQDLSVEALDAGRVRAARVVGLCVPMHTAIALGVHAGRKVRRLHPEARIVFYGLYASLNADYLLGQGGDAVIGGEYERPLLEWLEALESGGPTPAGVATPERPGEPPRIGRSRHAAPSRDGLPGLSAYARLIDGERQRVTGYVETTKGCKHHCLHCPLPPVYGGRFFVVSRDVVLADLERLVAAGAEHITFGDPDFLNGPGHSLALARALHERHPGVTFDFTAKVEHLLRHRHRLPELRELGCAFIVSAVESLSDTVLARLQKGHTRADVEALVALSRATGVPVRPSLLPFTPWSTLDDYLDLLEWIRRERLVEHIDPVQLSIRLLVPPGSALLGTPQFEPHRGELDREAFTYRWAHPDPRMDALHREVSAIVEDAAEDEEDPYRTFTRIAGAAHATAGRPGADAAQVMPLPPPEPVPRLSEPWFC